MACEFRITRRVEFSDTDAAGIVHFAHFFRYMEAAEQAFFRSLGFTVHGRGPGVRHTWPRVQARCEYHHPLRFEDEVEVHLLVKEIGRKSLRYQFIFRTLGEHARDVARGELTVASVALDPVTGKMHAVPLPAEVLAQIETAPAEALRERSRSA